jgi:hypothetical protein
MKDNNGIDPILVFVCALLLIFLLRVFGII